MPSGAFCCMVIFSIQIRENTRMKRSDEIEALANRFAARAASSVFLGQPEMQKDMSAAVPLVRAQALVVRTKEIAETNGNGHGAEKPAAAAPIVGG
jgi:hypothetical protein